MTPVTAADLARTRLILRATLDIHTAQTPEEVQDALRRLQAAGLRPVWEVVNGAVARLIALKEKR